MNTKAQAFDAIVTATKSIFGDNIPEIHGTTHVGALAVGVSADENGANNFAQVVSDCLALLPPGEAEVSAILGTEMTRAYPDDGTPGKMDHRAMTIDQFAERIANLPSFEG